MRPSSSPVLSPCSSSISSKGISAYCELCELHNGRHSTVWSAREADQPDSVVVIKGYSKLRLKPRQLRNVTRELHLLRLFTKTRCKGVVQLLSSFEEDACVYLVFEACMHGDLYQLLVRHRGELTEEFIVVQVVVPMLTTLAHLHRLHIVHRDIKPENIFINRAGEMLIGDFGLAAHTVHDKLTERVGTLDYMAPEVLAMPTPDEVSTSNRTKPLRPYTEKVDVWAVGILVYEMLAGAPPFEVEDPKETAQLIMKSPVRHWPAGLSPECRDFIELTLEKKASARPGAQELLSHPWITSLMQSEIEPPCPDLAAKALKRIIHASWNVTTLASLLDTTPVALHSGNVMQNAALIRGSVGMTASRTSLASSKCRSLSSGEDDLFVDSEDEETEPAPFVPAPPHRTSLPGNNRTIDHLGPNISREQLRAGNFNLPVVNFSGSGHGPPTLSKPPSSKGRVGAHEPHHHHESHKPSAHFPFDSSLSEPSASATAFVYPSQASTPQDTPASSSSVPHHATPGSLPTHSATHLPPCEHSSHPTPIPPLPLKLASSLFPSPNHHLSPSYHPPGPPCNSPVGPCTARDTAPRRASSGSSELLPVGVSYSVGGLQDGTHGGAHDMNTGRVIERSISYPAAGSCAKQAGETERETEGVKCSRSASPLTSHPMSGSEDDADTLGDAEATVRSFQEAPFPSFHGTNKAQAEDKTSHSRSDFPAVCNALSAISLERSESLGQANGSAEISQKQSEVGMASSDSKLPHRHSADIATLDGLCPLSDTACAQANSAQAAATPNSGIILTDKILQTSDMPPPPNPTQQDSAACNLRASQASPGLSANTSTVSGLGFSTPSAPSPSSQPLFHFPGSTPTQLPPHSPASTPSSTPPHAPQPLQHYPGSVPSTSKATSSSTAVPSRLATGLSQAPPSRMAAGGRSSSTPVGKNTPPMTLASLAVASSSSLFVAPIPPSASTSHSKPDSPPPAHYPGSVPSTHYPGSVPGSQRPSSATHSSPLASNSATGSATTSRFGAPPSTSASPPMAHYPGSVPSSAPASSTHSPSSRFAQPAAAPPSISASPPMAHYPGSVPSSAPASSSHSPSSRFAQPSTASPSPSSSTPMAHCPGSVPSSTHASSSHSPSSRFAQPAAAPPSTSSSTPMAHYPGSVPSSTPASSSHSPSSRFAQPSTASPSTSASPPMTHYPGSVPSSAPASSSHSPSSRFAQPSTASPSTSASQPMAHYPGSVPSSTHASSSHSASTTSSRFAQPASTPPSASSSQPMAHYPGVVPSSSPTSSSHSASTPHTSTTPSSRFAQPSSAPAGASQSSSRFSRTSSAPGTPPSSQTDPSCPRVHSRVPLPSSLLGACTLPTAQTHVPRSTHGQIPPYNTQGLPSKPPGCGTEPELQPPCTAQSLPGKAPGGGTEPELQLPPAWQKPELVTAKKAPPKSRFG